MIVAITQLVVGLALLFVGGHYLVRGAVRIALLARISTAVVGLTVVAMGTSLPELAVSVSAALDGVTDLAYANIVGSSIFNIGVILGIAALLLPINVERQTIKIEYPFMLVVAALVVVLCLDRRIGFAEGLLFLVLLVLFTLWVIHLARRRVFGDEAMELEREVERTASIAAGTTPQWGKNLLWVAGGIAALVLGADRAVDGAVHLATSVGVSQRILGLTIVAMGTSLPELATSIVAARQGEQEIALGNVIGSNIFNLLGVLGATAVVVPVPINPRAVTLDNWVMLAFCAGMFPLMLYGRRKLGRIDGVILLAGFSVYALYLVLGPG
ncbi:MAG: calcium/sodium antiporter [Gemmatimonadales bacterium]